MTAVTTAPSLAGVVPVCGRFTLAADPADLAIHFALEQPPTLTARYNIAPSQNVAVVAPKKVDPSRRGLALLKWGLVPYWLQDGKAGPINARCETVGRLNSFSDAFKQRRCIIPATGFYEWPEAGGKKIPHRFRLASGGLLGFAGLWEWWTREDQSVLYSCCLIAAPANPLVASLHDRMPAILAPDEYAAWLDAATPRKEAHAILKPYPAEVMAVSEANVQVNSPRNEGPELLNPAA
jgi:putative SOS response-associated peptidase YedK